MSVSLLPLSPRSPHTPFHSHDLARSLQPSPTPSPPSTRRLPIELSLLIPATRWTDEIEDAWKAQLGNFQVLEEVRLKGYQLHGVNDWLMQTHRLVQTVVNYTGVESHHVTAFRLVPSPDMSEEQAQHGINKAIAMLSQASQAKTKITEYGWIMVTSLSSFNLSTVAISCGDLREAMPTIIVNTNLRRLGCSGRAELRLDQPSDAFRRKFSEMYHIDCPGPPSLGTPISRSDSPSASPHKHRHTHSLGSPPVARSELTIDSFPVAVIELGKLIQASLVLFGYFKAGQKRVEPDGLLCDGVMKGFEQWIEGSQRAGLELGTRTFDRRTEDMITPPFVALLLSSVTAVRYKLASVSQSEKVPKDPFSEIERFQNSWRGWQLSNAKNQRVESLYITPSLQRRLDATYDKTQPRNPDRYKNPINKIRSQVAHATSALSLKASTDDQSLSWHRDPSRRMAYDSAGDSEAEAGHSHRHDGPSGFALDHPVDDLELYVRNITKLRHRDLESVGGIRIARLWTGKVVHDYEIVNGYRRDRRLDPLRRRTESREYSDRDLKAFGERFMDGEDSKRGSLRSTMSKTQLAIGKLGRSRQVEDTSDSDSAAHGQTANGTKGPSRKAALAIPSVVEPDVEEVDEGLSVSFGRNSRNGTSPPGPSSFESRLQAPTDQSFRSTRTTSTRPSINTAISYSGSDANSLAANGAGSRRGSRAYDAQVSIVEEGGSPSWPTTPLLSRSAKMMRTASDGAEVSSEGVEFTVKQPRGGLMHTRHGHDAADEIGSRRRHSLADRVAYSDMTVDHPDHMAIDIRLCQAVWDLRVRERQMALKIQHIEALEREVERALDMVRTETVARQTRVAALQTEAQTLIGELPNAREELPLSLFEVTRLEEELSWNVDNISNIFRATQRKELERLLLVLERKDADDPTVQAVTVDKDKNEEQGEPSRSRWWHWW